jgi:hypothetical protein
VKSEQTNSIKQVLYFLSFDRYQPNMTLPSESKMKGNYAKMNEKIESKKK